MVILIVSQENLDLIKQRLDEHHSPAKALRCLRDPVYADSWHKKRGELLNEWREMKFQLGMD